MTAIWDDPDRYTVTAGEIECCQRCAHLARDLPQDFSGFRTLQYVHWLWRDFHRAWREGDPIE